MRSQISHRRTSMEARAEGAAAIAIFVLFASAAPAFGQDTPQPKCRWIKPTARVEAYDTSSYNTTLTSALIEGATEGLSDGLSGEDAVSQTIRQATLKSTTASGSTLLKLPWSRPPFCRKYQAPTRSVSVIVADLLPLLGQRIIVSSVDAGVFLTDFRDYSHPMAKWKDRYLISVTQDEDGATTVRVQRTVYVSHTPEVYNRATSSGRNETWILTQITDRLSAGRP